MASARTTPILLLEALDPQRAILGLKPGDTLRAELTEDLARQWDQALSIWTSWASTPNIQANAGRSVAPQSVPHLLASPEIPQIVDGRGIELHGLANPLDRGLALHIAIAQKRRPG